MARQAGPAGADLLREAERLAGEELRRAEIAKRLGFKSPTTFDSRLVKASQQTGKPVPSFKAVRRANRWPRDS
jgi:AraC-like DNA-binding protein